jgi:hypothetical protein
MLIKVNEWRVEVLGDPDAPFRASKPWPPTFVDESDEPCNRLSIPGQDDLLTLNSGVQQIVQGSLGLFNVDDLHVPI